MKKLVSIILAAAMILSLASVSMAAENGDTKQLEVNLTASLEPECEWSIPDSSLTLKEGNSYSDSGTVEIKEWRVVHNYEWTVNVDTNLLTLADGTNTVKANVEFNKIHATEKDASAYSLVTVSVGEPDIEELFGDHLAGTIEATGTLTFTLSYEEAN